MTPKLNSSQTYAGGSDGAESDETAAFSPRKARYIRRQIWWVALSSAGVLLFGGWSAVAILVKSPIGYLTMPWAFLFFILAFDAGCRITETFATERDKARNDRRTLARLVAVRNGRIAGEPVDGEMWELRAPSTGNVFNINGHRFGERV